MRFVRPFFLCLFFLQDVVTPKSKSKLLPANNSGFQPWMYTVIGAICGTLLVVFLIMSFMTYRRRRLTRRTYQFNFDVNYLRARSLSDSYMSDNNNSYVMEPTSPIPEVNHYAEPHLYLYLLYWAKVSRYCGSAAFWLPLIEMMNAMN